MDAKLLVRSYDVGFGDCIFVKVPDGEGCFNILIDCGTSASSDPKKNPKLKNAVDDILSELSKDGDGNRHLDLLVMTHPHADHIKGFDPKWFKKVKIDRIWLPVFIKSDHPQAEKAFAFQQVSSQVMKGFLARKDLGLSPSVLEMMLRSIGNEGALDALHKKLAELSAIWPNYPLYVARDLADRLSNTDRDKYELEFDRGTTCFRGFKESDTCIRILAPEWDIDKYYLGKGIQDVRSMIDQYSLATDFEQTRAITVSELNDNVLLNKGSKKGRSHFPTNISQGDFRRLKNRLLYSALAFSQKDDDLKNNTSVVLLLEWHGRRLLFTGDAEWSGTGVKENRDNSAWDVMLGVPKVKKVLLRPLDFLKVAHHGSQNGTPFQEKGQDILKKMLKPDRSQVVVSTEPGVHSQVPHPSLLRSLGELAHNKQKYLNEPCTDLSGIYQPQRTDLEADVPGKQARYVEVFLSAGGS